MIIKERSDKLLQEKLKSMIEASSNIVFFGGAGTSTESGIPDFRSEQGIYNIKGNSFVPEVILSHNFFIEYTEEFYGFYKNKMIYPNAKPNSAHTVLAELEDRGKIKAVITQNIDGLHQMAGSKNVMELHGSIHRNSCLGCGRKYDLKYIIESEALIPVCHKCGGILKPDVVLYGENLDGDVLEKAIEYLSRADMLIVGGTSLVVYPAAGLLEYYKGRKLVLINKSTTQYDSAANLIINDSIAEVLKNSIL
jgi:NAD-dependent deacetylase